MSASPVLIDPVALFAVYPYPKDHLVDPLFGCSKSPFGAQFVTQGASELELDEVTEDIERLELDDDVEPDEELVEYVLAEDFEVTVADEEELEDVVELDDVIGLVDVPGVELELDIVVLEADNSAVLELEVTELKEDVVETAEFDEEGLDMEESEDEDEDDVVIVLIVLIVAEIVLELDSDEDATSKEALEVVVLEVEISDEVEVK